MFLTDRKKKADDKKVGPEGTRAKRRGNGIKRQRERQGKAKSDCGSPSLRRTGSDASAFTPVRLNNG